MYAASIAACAWAGRARDSVGPGWGWVGGSGYGGKGGRLGPRVGEGGERLRSVARDGKG